MIAEQLWDADPVSGSKLTCGSPTGSAMPLCWSHAEYLSLVRSRRDGVCFDRIDPVHVRYVLDPHSHTHEIWTLRHQTRRIPEGRTLRLILAAPATCRWTFDGWKTQTDTPASECGLPGLWHLDLPTPELDPAAIIEWTFCWEENVPRWEGRNFQVTVA